MKHLIIGTAGHVDHGKTALVRALTGIDTDRLKEEKERGISIELGFASLQLPGGRRAGIVDVPGHERFIKNMLAGAGGFDLVLLVIAADEGVMPQTREHLDILQLLQVQKGIVVLTKTDLVEDDWLELVEEEARDFLKGTVLEDAPVLKVSAVTGQGIRDLLEKIDQLAGQTVSRVSSGSPRLPVDRVFTITGFGTVVTGTLVAGVLRVGDSVEIQPQGLVSRVRSLQVHGEKVEVAEAGQRVAVNLAGLELEQVERGSVVAGVKTLTPANRVDIHLLLLDSAARPLKNRTRVRFYLGTSETLGRVVLLDREEMEPGTLAYAQVELEEQLVAAKGDRFVIRSYSPMETIGGGTVIDPLPRRKHKRFRSEVLSALATRERGTPAELVDQFLTAGSGLHIPGEIATGTGLKDEEIVEAASELVKEGRAKMISGDGKTYYVSSVIYQRWSAALAQLLETYHRDFPLREGYPREDLRSRKFQVLNSRVFQMLLLEMEKDGLLRVTPQAVALQGFAAGPSPQQEKLISRIKHELEEFAFLPPSWNGLSRSAGLDEVFAAELLQYMLRTGDLVKIAEELYFLKDVLASARQKVSQSLRDKGEITVAEVRDLLQTSRKFALPLLEYFDREKLTRRVGDKRLPGRALEN
ncbi:Selenocysteine-specific elongation factor [Pelotomaculum schinkii]|uniref:Selenocysteine-specific elongation factor n=1 Tax=Pelotomaculum schinkii TaxID=78350 RepID=A0A4Y7RDK6_9FIRM|nr:MULTISPECIES: selenocysteine-specific translation elongation factor [Pelotomaculum]TEB07074.1 Selenocysteine-specific elongation factor [Pelotomaculum schinkii]TEB16993.1 Selenocysteine-specific elongation factor [Pelotomaculum sp. FP]